MPSPYVDIVPLGGLGEIGMNCLVLDCPEGAFLVDCGTTFPEDDRGIDVIHPSFEWLHAIAPRLLGVFLTHGHEDHIGALPYLLRAFELPVWGSGHALALVEKRLAEHGFKSGQVEFREVDVGQEYRLGPYRVEPVRMSHSIAEATSLAIMTPAGRVVHSGDFNFDPWPSDGESTNVERLASLGQQGIELLLSDSTNVDSEQQASSERDVARVLEELIQSLEQRVVVALFASNMQRLITLGRIAQATGRRLCLLGRSLSTHVEIARRRGLLDWPDEMLLPAQHAQSCPPRRLLALAGGTQAEAGSALSRLALGGHHALRLESEDHVIFSSRVIPGNEREVSRLEDQLLRLGVVVHSRRTLPGVHTSGHAHRPEQRKLIELLRPHAFVPVHGTLHHLKKHAELAAAVGVPQLLVTENGQPVRLQDRCLQRLERIPSGQVAIARGGMPLEPVVLKERTELGRQGVVLLSLRLSEDFRVQGKVLLTSVGVPGLRPGNELQLCLEQELTVWLGRQRAPGQSPSATPADGLRRAVRRMVETATGVRPQVEVHLFQEP